MYDGKPQIFTPLIDAFNDYSKAHNLNIEADLKLLSPQNSTTNVDGMASLIAQLLVKNSTKYDIYFDYCGYNAKNGEHFINLYDYLEEDHLNLYKYDYLQYINIYKDKLVGLVNIIFFNY